VCLCIFVWPLRCIYNVSVITVVVVIYFCIELRLRDVLPDCALLFTVAVTISSRYIIAQCGQPTLLAVLALYALWTINEQQQV